MLLALRYHGSAVTSTVLIPFSWYHGSTLVPPNTVVNLGSIILQAEWKCVQTMLVVLGSWWLAAFIRDHCAVLCYCFILYFLLLIDPRNPSVIKYGSKTLLQLCIKSSSRWISDLADWIQPNFHHWEKFSSSQMTDSMPDAIFVDLQHYLLSLLS